MKQQQKMKLLSILFGNDSARQFLCKDFFQELSNLIPISKCINNENIVSGIRNKNYDDVLSTLSQFLKDNLEYKKMIKDLLSITEDNELEKHLLMSYVFYCCLTDSTNKNIDIFKDKRSICYTEAPPLYDLL